MKLRTTAITVQKTEKTMWIYRSHQTQNWWFRRWMDLQPSIKNSFKFIYQDMGFYFYIDKGMCVYEDSIPSKWFYCENKKKWHMAKALGLRLKFRR